MLPTSQWLISCLYSVSYSESDTQTASSQEDASVESDSPQVPPEPDPSMQDYYRLQRELLLVTLALTAVAFGSSWAFYSFNTALNYLVGACAGIFYLRLLAKHVEELGRQRRQLGQTRIAVFIALIIAASQLNQFEILPIFLGFLTYKAALIVYVLRTTLIPSSS